MLKMKIVYNLLIRPHYGQLKLILEDEKNE